MEATPTSKKHLIIQSFEKMDITMLEVLLDDFRTYQDTTKEIFLERLDIIFQELKTNGNTHLISYTGCCTHSSCPNKGCKGYSFVADKSRKHLDLIFDENETDYVDICHCSEFKIVTPPSGIKQSISINIYEDEEVDFKPTADFLVLSHNCKNAVEELSEYANANVTVDKNIYEKWCIKYNELYCTGYEYCEEYSTVGSDVDMFLSLYLTLAFTVHYIELNDAATSSAMEYPAVDNEDDFPLLQWLVKYEDLRDTISQKTQLLLLTVEKSAHYYKVKSIDLKINIHDFEGINRFNQLFDKPYEKMLDKYTTFNDSNFTRAHRDSDKSIADNLYTLSYHLRMRRII